MIKFIIQVVFACFIVFEKITYPNECDESAKAILVVLTLY